MHRVFSEMNSLMIKTRSPWKEITPCLTYVRGCNSDKDILTATVVVVLDFILMYSNRRLSLLDNLGTITYNSVMGVEDLGLSRDKSYPVGPDGKKLKPCCACPETKKARDACIVEKGEEYCIDLIEAHKACMRNLGFNV